MRVLLCVLALVACVSAIPYPSLSATNTQAWRPHPDQFVQWMKEGGFDVTGREPFPVLRRKIIDRLRPWLEGQLITHNAMPEIANGGDYPYFGFIPMPAPAVIPGQAAVSWSNACFQQNTASALQTDADTVTVTVTVENATSLLCSDLYLFGTLSSISLNNFFFHGEYNVSFNLTGLTPAELWDIANNGVRVFTFPDNILSTIGDLLATVLLFGSEATMGVPDWVASLNVDFMSKYRGVTMTKRPIYQVNISESDIASGDFFGIIRLDGLDPMLAWAMGSTTGHTAVALRIDGQLYVTESTVNDSYWPTNGIQKTPYQQWITQAIAAGHQVVHAPLSPEYRALFNETAAALRFAELEGFDYGYHNLFFGWIDTVKDNYPCLPPDYKQCLTVEAIELLIGIAEKLIPSIAETFFLEALNHRLGTSGMRIAELMQTAAARGIDFPTVPVMVEKDDYMYNTTRNGVPTVGPSMVCCVFVCNMWRAGGIFNEIDNQINCAELTNWDDYSLTIMDSTSPRPPQCVTADPNNQLCQLLGEYTLNLDDYSTKKMFPWIAQSCPSLPPNYEKPANC